MSEREQKLEAALQRAQAFIQDTDLHLEGQMEESETKRVLREIHVALAAPPTKPQQTIMPDWDNPPYTRSSCAVTTKRYKISSPTSEWNEAIEAARQAVLNEATRIEEEGRWDDYTAYVNAICSLKRKERP